jgi:hypothetical protein
MLFEELLIIEGVTPSVLLEDPPWLALTLLVARMSVLVERLGQRSLLRI